MKLALILFRFPESIGKKFSAKLVYIMCKLWLRARIFAAVLCLFAAGARAEDAFEAQHQRAVTANPQGLHFTIALEPAKQKFRIGETITVQYRFTSDSPGKYLADMHAYDLARRSTLETFVTDGPEATADPLGGYAEIYHAVYRDHSSSNQAREPVGLASPRPESFSLTRYLRFRQLGVYRLYAITRQVVPNDFVQHRAALTRGGSPLTSENVITFELEPRDDDESAKQVEAIVARSIAGTPPRLSQADAFRLFEIDTTQSRQAAAQLYDYYHDDASALAIATMLAAPSRTEVIALLEERLRYEKQPVDRDLLQELALVQTLQQNPNLTAEVIDRDRRATVPWRQFLADQLLADFRAAVETIEHHTPAARALTAKFLHQMAVSCNCGLPREVSDQEKLRLQSLRLAGLTDLPREEQLNELRYMEWADDIPKTELLPVLQKVYEDLPIKFDTDYECMTVLRDIAWLDRQLAGVLFQRRVIDREWVPQTFALVEYQPLDLPGSPELDAYLIKTLESRRTEDMEHVAPIIGVFATPAVLPRVKKIYDIYGAGWPCPMQPGLLGYFMRTDPIYASQRLRAALSPQSLNAGGACDSLLLDVARIFNAPELAGFAEAALNDPRPQVANVGLQVLTLNRVSAVPYRPLLARLGKLHEEWSDFPNRKGDPQYLQRWQAGYSWLEDRIRYELTRVDDSPENLAVLKQALDFCVSDGCRRNFQERIDSFPVPPQVEKKFSPLTNADQQRISALPVQQQAEELLERSIEHDRLALALLEQNVNSWTGKIKAGNRMKQLEWRSRFSTDLRVRRANIDINLAMEGYRKEAATAELLIERAKSDPQRRASALYLLGMLGGRGVESARVHQLLVQYAKNDRNPLVRQWAVEGLRFLGTDQALDELYDSFLHDPDYRVRDRAGCNLADCGAFTRKQRMRFVPKLIFVATNERLTTQMHDWVFMALRGITDESIPDEATAWQKWQRQHGQQKAQKFASMAWWRVRGDE